MQTSRVISIPIQKAVAASQGKSNAKRVSTRKEKTKEKGVKTKHLGKKRS